MHPRTSLGVSAVAVLATALTAVPLALSAPASAGPQSPGQRTGCYDTSLPTTVEESRLTVRTAPDQEPASDQLLRAGGFDRYADRFDAQLCQATTLKAARLKAARHGTRLWRTAVDRAHGQRPDLGTIDAYDDRPLYWAHLRATKALRQWAPRGVELTPEQRTDLVTTFVEHARGLTDTDFPRGRDVTRVLVSGFDPYTLETEPRRSNPSGVTALQLDGTRYETDKGTVAIESVVFPVTWSGFDAGIVEDAFGPHLRLGDRQRVDLITTISQGSAFNIEQWAGRWRGGSPDNNNEGEPEVIPENPAWPMPQPPPEFIETTLPHEAMIAAGTGPFPVRLNPRICEWHPATSPADNVCHDGPPTPGWRAYSGGGGNYLSNESQYRSNRVRIGLGALDVPGGHLHTPPQTYAADRTVLLDEEMRQLRHDIADQAVALVRAAAAAVQED
ncbi:hypothetical protein [Nocardioides sp. GXQ0305]|uniref:hypothetical protein n=1 Tax=Nocardioides sp. GXQ0305 TaxID=3423912 RepID=UPI003D7ECA07